MQKNTVISSACECRSKRIKLPGNWGGVFISLEFIDQSVLLAATPGLPVFVPEAVPMLIPAQPGGDILVAAASDEIDFPADLTSAQFDVSPAPADQLEPGLEPVSSDDGDNQELLVTGRPPYRGPMPDLYGGGGGDSGGGGGGGGGGNSNPGNGASDLPYPQDCPTPGMAADGIRDKITGTMSNPPDSNAPGWHNTEYGALVTWSAAGWGAYGDMIHTDGLVDRAGIPTAPPEVLVAGIIHNHPDELGTSLEDARQRYPSTGDWISLQFVKDRHGGSNSSHDPSLWIVDASGKMREFKLSQKDFFESLTEAQRETGEGLPAETTEQSCGG